MNIIKITVLISFISLISLPLIGQLRVGAGTTLNLEAEALGFQGKASYEHEDTWRGVGTFTIYIDKVLDWTIDFDGQYKLVELGENFNISPMAGISIWRNSIGDISDLSIGLNLGAFLDFRVQERLVYIEPKLVARKGSGFVLSAGMFF